MEIEQILSLLQMIRISAVIPLAICIAAVGLLVILYPIPQIRRQIYEVAHPPAPEPEIPKKRVITATIPTRVKEQLEILLSFEANSSSGWGNTSSTDPSPQKLQEEKTL